MRQHKGSKEVPDFKSQISKIKNHSGCNDQHFSFLRGARGVRCGFFYIFYSFYILCVLLLTEPVFYSSRSQSQTRSGSPSTHGVSKEVSKGVLRTYGPAERILGINPVNPVNPVKNNNCPCAQSKIIQNYLCRPYRTQKWWVRFPIPMAEGHGLTSFGHFVASNHARGSDFFNRSKIFTPQVHINLIIHNS